MKILGTKTLRCEFHPKNVMITKAEMDRLVEIAEVKGDDSHIKDITCPQCVKNEGGSADIRLSHGVVVVFTEHAS